MKRLAVIYPAALQHGRGNMAAPPNFWKDAKRTRVTWSRSDPRLRALIAETQFPGLYALVDGDRVLKVGIAGIVPRADALHAPL
jgi:hypothetical protein